MNLNQMRRAETERSATSTWCNVRTLAVLLALVTIGALSAIADDPNPNSSAPPVVHVRRRPVAAKAQPAAPQPAPAPPQPEAPKPPDWPANNHPSEATVVWNSKGLRIDASNSSLQQILKEVATATGAKVSGATADQRIFGTYGPGPARDVLSQLLQGSGYNMLMIGDQGQGTPRQILLSRRPTGPAPQTANNAGSSDDDDSNAVMEEPPQPQPEPQQPQPPANGPGPGMPPRTPQQILQEMQQRQQQIEQQQQNANPPNQ